MASSVANYQVGKGIVYLRRFNEAPTVWATNTAYATGDYVVNANDEYLWTVTTGGTSGTGSGPTGSTGTFTDGTVTWAAVEWVDLGNAPKFAWNAEVETLEHFSSRTGIKTRDKKVVLSRKGSLSIILDEITVENLELAVMGTTTGSAPNRTTEIFADAQVDCQVKLVGSNDVGNQFNWFLGNVSLVPGQEVSVIGDDWTQIEITGEVNADANGKYGTITES